MDRHHEPREPGFGMLETVETVPDTAAEDDEAESFLEYRAFRDKNALESARWAGYSEVNPSLQTLDILQESTTLLRKHNSLLGTLALTLAVPLSVILLSHVLLALPFMERLVRAVEFAAEQRVQHRSHRVGYRRLAEIIMSNVVDIPFSALFSPLLKAGVAYIVGSTYRRQRPELSELVRMLQKVWIRLMQTFAWSCSVYLTFASAFASLLWFASSAGKSSNLIVTVSLAAAAVIGLTLTAGFAYANVMCNLAYVISALEGFEGRDALLQSMHLLRGKLQVTLLLFLVTNVNGTLLDILFEFHIIRNSDDSIVYDKYWEAPLLVCMHSFVYLFDAIMVSVLYYMCKAAESAESPALHAVEDDHPSAFESSDAAPL